MGRALASDFGPRVGIAPSGRLAVGFVLLDGFSMLSLASAIEPLNAIARGPRPADLRWTLCTPQGRSVTASNGMTLPVACGFDGLDACDVILVCAGSQARRQIDGPLLAQLRRLFGAGRIVGGLDTGVFALAAAGLLGSRRFVLHQSDIAVFTESWPDLTPTLSLYCEDRRILTCAGGAAAADMMLALVTSRLGAAVSRMARVSCTLPDPREADTRQPDVLPMGLRLRHRGVALAVRWIEQRLDERLDVDACAAAAGLSRRQLERAFRRYLSQTPVGFVNALRLEKAQKLLMETDMSVTEVAVAVGFDGLAYFSRLFRKRFGIRPSDVGL